jgi:hypothetical protein
MPLINVSQLALEPEVLSETARREIHKIDLLCEEMCISWREADKIAKELVGTEKVRELGAQEARKMVEYLKRNRSRLSEKHRRMRWQKQ